MTRIGRTSNRGFTLVEMMTCVAIVGLIVLLMGYEFDAAIGNLLHTRSNRDMSSTARVVMTKVTNRLRTASPWAFNPAPVGSVNIHQVFLSPIPVTSPGNTSSVLQFYRVRPGSLSNSGIIPKNPSGNPNPPYDLVTIQRSTCPTLGCKDLSPNYLVETAIDASALTPTEAPLVLGKDVTNFSVTATGGDAAQINVSLTITSQSPRCAPHCSSDVTSSMWVGGDQVNANE